MKILELPYKTDSERQAYYDWITRTGVSCMWDYYRRRGVNIMLVEFKDEDAVAFKLAFKI